MNFSAYSGMAKPEGGNYKPLDPGCYKATVKACQKKTSKAGNNYINIRFECRDKDENKVGTVFEMMFTDSEKNFLQYKAGRIGMAFGLDKVEQELSDDQIIKFLEGKTCCVVTKIKEYNNKQDAELDYEKFDGIYPLAQFAEVYGMFYDGASAEPDMSFLNPQGNDEELPFGGSESNAPAPAEAPAPAATTGTDPLLDF